MCEFRDLRPQSVGEKTFWKIYTKKPKSTFDLELIFKPITFVDGSKVIHMCEFGDLRPQSVGEENFEILPQKTKIDIWPWINF